MKKSFPTLLIFLTTLIVVIPAYAQYDPAKVVDDKAMTGGIVPCEGVVVTGGTGTECTFDSLFILMQNIITFLLYIAMSIAAAAFFMAGFKYITAHGNPSQIESAHKIFTNVVVGLLIALGAWLVVHTILVALLPTTPVSNTLLVN